MLLLFVKPSHICSPFPQRNNYISLSLNLSVWLELTPHQIQGEDIWLQFDQSQHQISLMKVTHSGNIIQPSQKPQDFVGHLLGLLREQCFFYCSAMQEDVDLAQLTSHLPDGCNYSHFFFFLNTSHLFIFFLRGTTVSLARELKNEALKKHSRAERHRQGRSQRQHLGSMNPVWPEGNQISL